jgi:glyoxylase-like metal-dependent hydrolase (beta-lactamase superfamily II)
VEGKGSLSDGIVQLTRLELEPFGTNAYILVCKSSQESVLVDAPGAPDKILQQLKGTHTKYILLTHGHLDHVQALSELREKLQAPVAGHRLDGRSLPLSLDISLNDGDYLSFGNVRLEVLHTPGHTPGSLCFLTGRYLLAGDTIFPGGPGKTSSPEALRQIVLSIERKVMVLSDDTHIYPGHGPSTVLSKEKREFAVFRSRPHGLAFCGDVLWLSS